MSKNTYDQNDGSYVVKKSKSSSVVAFIICFLIAFVIWAYTASYGLNKQNASNTDASNEQTVETQQTGDAQ